MDHWGRLGPRNSHTWTALGTFAGKCHELDTSDLPSAQNVDGVEFTTAPVPARTQPPTSAVRGAASLVQLAPERTIFVHSGVDGEIVIGRIVDNFQYLPARAMHAARGPVSLPVEVLPIKEVKPMRAVVSTRGGVEMEGSHNTVESVPGEDVTGRLSCWIEIESSHAPPATVSAIAHLVARQENGEVTIAVLVHWVGVLRRSRGWWSEHQDRGGEGQAGSRPSRIADAYAVLHRGPFLVVVGHPRIHFCRVRPYEPNLESRRVLATATYARARTAGTKNCRCDCSPDLSQG